MEIKELITKIENDFPICSAMSFDNSGANIVDYDDELIGIVVTLDVTIDAIEYAKKNDANLIISHHPIIFNEIKSINDDPLSKRIKLLNKYGISAYSCHTNYDSNLSNGMGINVLNKLFDNSLIEKHSILEKYKALNIDYGIGDIITLKKEMSFNDIKNVLIEKLNLDEKKISEYKVNDSIKKLIIIPGSGSGSIDLVLEEKPDLLITSDLKHNQILDLTEFGISYINATHYGLEKVFEESFVKYLSSKTDKKIYIIKNKFM